jgi:hypothetical protein
MDIYNGLEYQWVAEYDNGTTLKQFERIGGKIEERMFRDLEIDKIAKFSVEKIKGDHNLTVNLRDGLFYLNGVELAMVESNGEMYNIGREINKWEYIKLIYFRRVTVTLNREMKEVEGKKILHFIGWEGIFNGKKEKWELAVSNTTGELIIPQYNLCSKLNNDIVNSMKIKHYLPPC